MTMDNDLAGALQQLKDIFRERFVPANFAPAVPDSVKALRSRLNLPSRYAQFLTHADPVDVETQTPAERVRFIPSADLEAEQVGYFQGDSETPARPGWHKGWIVIGHSTLLGDPYFLDTTRVDAEGDCPVMTAMNGGKLEPVLCASNFTTFLQILAAAMKVAEGFAADADPDEEYIFKETLGGKVRSIDGAAFRSGHWNPRRR